VGYDRDDCGEGIPSILSDEITNGPVYRPFFFHICRPFEFALYDQHTYRKMLPTNGKQEEG
jgi:hypothetical protein